VDVRARLGGPVNTCARAVPCTCPIRFLLDFFAKSYRGIKGVDSLFPRGKFSRSRGVPLACKAYSRVVSRVSQ